MPAKQSRYWCFTSFQDKDGFLWYNPVDYIYLVQQEEECPTSKRVHWQGFVVLECKKALGYFKRLLPSAHFECMRGSLDEAADYCCDPRKRMPGGLLLEDGFRPLYGDAARSASTTERYKRAYDLAVSGDFENIDPAMMIKHFGNIIKINTLFGIKPASIQSDTCPGVWLVGAPGSGKTTLVQKFKHYSKSAENKWFDGYARESCIVVDDFAPFHVAQTNILKQLGHQYAFQAETKGASIWVRPLACVVTSQYMIHDVWAKDSESAAAIARRYKSFTVPYDACEAVLYIERLLAYKPPLAILDSNIQ